MKFNTQARIALLLAVVMLVTRSQHFATFTHLLPDASVAVFFMAGFYAQSRLLFPALCVLGVAIDAVAINLAGVSSFCVTPSYIMLIPAYGVMWMGGRWLSHNAQQNLSGLAKLVGVAALSSFASDLISSGSFYFFGGRFAEPTLAGFLPRLQLYTPPAMAWAMTYIGIAAMVHVMLVKLSTQHRDLTPAA